MWGSPPQGRLEIFHRLECPYYLLFYLFAKNYLYPLWPHAENSCPARDSGDSRKP